MLEIFGMNGVVMHMKTTLDEFIEKSIKPCPFCGNRPKIKYLSWDMGGISTLEMECCMDFIVESDRILRIETIENQSCGTIGMNAIEKWNRRAT